jgi:hypothetical protein
VKFWVLEELVETTGHYPNDLILQTRFVEPCLRLLIREYREEIARIGKRFAFRSVSVTVITANV